MSCRHCQAKKRSRQTRIALVLLRGAGMSIKQCAGLLGVSRAGVDFHWQTIVRRMGGDHYEVTRRSATWPQEIWGI